MNKTLEGHWEAYREAIIPESFTPEAVRALEQTFYAGADALWNCLLDIRAREHEGADGYALMAALADHLKRNFERFAETKQHEPETPPR